jgi:mRNA-degrading endonuclease RelE of RelBE toxin-antitoxin system
MWSPQLDILRQVRFPAISTYDSGKPPAAGRRGPELKPIDLAAVRGKLEAVAKEAIENDPVRLRARVANLERELAAAPARERTLAQAQQVAEQRGWERGVDEGYQAGLAEGRDTAVNTVRKLIERATALVEELVGDVTKPAPPAPVVARPKGKLVFAKTPSQPNQIPQKADLPRGERAVLIAAAQHPEGVGRQQLTVLTGYKRRTRDAYVQRLRERGYVLQAPTALGDRIQATAAGISALGSDFEPLPTGAALREHWLETLPEGERRILDLLLRAYPDDIERRAIDEATQYQRRTRDAYLQRLRARELIETAGTAVRATDKLFDGLAQ